LILDPRLDDGQRKTPAESRIGAIAGYQRNSGNVEPWRRARDHKKLIE
jgi:hypothetical protein